MTLGYEHHGKWMIESGGEGKNKKRRRGRFQSKVVRHSGISGPGLRSRNEFHRHWYSKEKRERGILWIWLHRLLIKFVAVSRHNVKPAQHSSKKDFVPTSLTKHRGLPRPTCSKDPSNKGANLSSFSVPVLTPRFWKWDFVKAVIHMTGRC